MDRERKRGKLNKDEVAYIVSHANLMGVEEIANHLHRTVQTVMGVIKLHVKPVAPAIVTGTEAEEHKKIIIRQDLRNSEAWRNLKNEFIAEELKYFEEAYVKLMSQFKNDVLASEETQILQAIKFEILMSRNLKERRRAREDIERLEKLQTDFLSQFNNDPSQMTDTQKEYAINIETQLNSSRQAEQSRTGEYVKLQERHEALMKSLKAIRDQRVKAFETTKVNFLGIIKDLMNRDVQEREGRQVELMKMAGQKSYIDLGRPHTYDDNNQDSPILSCETVDLGPEELSE